jgi:large subunit ribosomal protein L47
MLTRRLLASATIGWSRATTQGKIVGTKTQFISTASPLRLSPLDAFRDSVDRQTRAKEPVGRPWSVQELRRKSYDDLHKLWYVLYKESNMLLTEQQLSRRRQIIFPQTERVNKVKKSMGAIKQVLGERKLVKLAEHNERMEQAELLEDVEEVAST